MFGPNLLQVIPLPELRRDKAVALLHEFVVDPNICPYLVSAAKKDFVWVERAFPGSAGNGVVRAALRSDRAGDNFGHIYLAVVNHVVERSTRLSYGSVHPPTPEGIRAAIDYVSYFMEGTGYTPSNPMARRLEVLVSEEMNIGSAVEHAGKVFPVRLAPWLPGMCAVVVPEDRGYLGDLHLFGSLSYAVVVHNPTRGMAVCVDA